MGKGGHMADLFRKILLALIASALLLGLISEFFK
jgi:hypothetical protein